jgi:iron complex transport system substrate-binding protein
MTLPLPRHRAGPFCFALFFLCLPLLIAVVAPPATRSGRIPVRDEMGRAVEIPAHPQRIVTMMPSLAEVVCALGLGDRLVGVSDYSDYPERAKSIPRVGSYVSPSLETIVALAPDLVLASKDGNPSWVVDKLADLGLAVYVTAPGNPEKLPASLARLGRICGRERTGRDLARRLENRFAEVARRLRGAAPVPALMVIGSHPLISVGKGTINHSLIRMAGGRNISAAGPGRWPRLGLEFVLESRPRVVVVSTMERGQKLDAELAYWRNLPGLAGTPGYRVESIQSDLIDRPGPRLGQGLTALAKILHPERFKTGEKKP